MVNRIDPSFFINNIKHAYAARKMKNVEVRKRECEITNFMYDLIVNSN